MRCLVLIREVIYQALCVFCFKGYDAGELALEVGIIGVESLGNEFGVILVLGEKNRFAQAVTTRNFRIPEVCLKSSVLQRRFELRCPLSPER